MEITIFNITKYVREALLKNTELSSLIGTRVYPMVIPQSTTFPFITIDKSSAEETNTKSGYGADYSVYVDITVYTSTHDSMVNLEEKVYEAMHKYFDKSASQIKLSNLQEDWADDTYVAQLSFSFSL